MSDPIRAQAGVPFVHFAADLPTGLEGVAQVRIIDPATDDVVLARTPTGIAESEVVPGLYRRTSTVADAHALLRIIWNPGDETGASGLWQEDLVVTETAPDVPGSTLPTIADVAALLHARTKRTSGQGGAETGTFDATTKPTGVQVADLIGRAADLVIGDLGIPADDDPARPGLVALRAAMLVETSYFTADVARGESVFDALRDQYNDTVSNIRGTTAAATAGGVGPWIA